MTPTEATEARQAKIRMHSCMNTYMNELTFDPQCSEGSVTCPCRYYHRGGEKEGIPGDREHVLVGSSERGGPGLHNQHAGPGTVLGRKPCASDRARSRVAGGRAEEACRGQEDPFPGTYLRVASRAAHVACSPVGPSSHRLHRLHPSQ